MPRAGEGRDKLSPKPVVKGVDNLRNNAHRPITMRLAP